MAQLFGQKMNVSGRLIKISGNLYFNALGHQVALFPYAAKKMPHLNFENIEAKMLFTVSFTTKPSKGGSYKVNLKKLSDMELKDFSLVIPEMDFVLENCNILNVESEFLQLLVIDIINLELANGRYEHILEREGTPYSEEEEMMALKIYVLTKGADYADMLAMVKESVEGGDVLRSVDSLEMKVNTYKSLDKDSGVGGLSATNAISKRLWESYKNGEIQF
jgi:hypothetical protein